MSLLKNLQKGTRIAFYCITATAMALLIASFVVPPTGVIDSSVLAAAGELFAFASLTIILIAIDKGIDAKVQHNNTTITIDGKDEDENA